MKFTVIALSLTVLLSACARHSTPSAVTAPYGETTINTEAITEGMAQQQLCWGTWREIYNQWIQNGGGIRSSIVATRRQIASDQKSLLARIIREVWSSPTDPRMKKSQLWGWPTDSNKERQISFLFSDASLGDVPHECATLIWLPAIVWDNIRFLNGNPGKFRMPSEAPTDVKWDGYTAPDWIIYWLLVKIPD